MGLFSLYLIRSNERIIGREPSYVLRQEWQKGPRLMCIAQHLNRHFGRGVSVFLLLLASGGCTSHQGVSSPVHGEMIPKRPQWSRAVTALSHTSRLPDPDSRYVYHYRRGAESGMEDRFPAVEGYHFFRFWPNGRFLYRNALVQGRELTSADGDTFGYGTVPGRYSVKGDQITVEQFDMLGEYVLRKGTLFPGGIIFYRDHFRDEQRYVRTQFPQGAMAKHPDW